jgi:hypothetical protein
MVAEIFAGLSGFNAMLNSAKALKDMNDAAVRNAAVIELQEQILSAQTAQATLLDRIRDLEKQMANFETWETEKQRYDLKGLGWGAFARMLKPTARGTEPPHWICTNCYGERRISVIQWGRKPKGATRNGYFCPACNNEIEPSPDALAPGTQDPKWLD